MAAFMKKNFLQTFQISSTMKLVTLSFCYKVFCFFSLLFLNQQVHAQRKNLVFESTFDSSSSMDKWYERNFLRPASGVIAHDIVRAGSGSFKVELNRKTDTIKGPRAELGDNPYQVPSESWYGFSNFFPADYVSDPATEIINQWQSLPDFSLGEAWGSPSLSLQIKSDRFKIAIAWCAAPVNTIENVKKIYLDIGPVTHNQWNDWVFHVKWSYNSGTLQIWKNDSLLLERLNQPIGYNDVYYPYFKAGIYKWEWHLPNTVSTTTKRTYYIDEIRIGNKAATYNDVMPKNTTPSLPISTILN